MKVNIAPISDKIIEVRIQVTGASESELLKGMDYDNFLCKQVATTTGTYTLFIN